MFRQLFTKHRPLIPDELWRYTLAAYPFLGILSIAQKQALKLSSEHFLSLKEFHAVAPLVLTDEMAVAIAAQACLPVLNIGLQHYDFVGIVLHADEVTTRREEVDADGVVHHFDDTLSGEAMPGGPVMLSWQDVQMAQSDPSDGTPYNVVIHEFVHLLDMASGELNGTPPLPSRAVFDAWQVVIQSEFQRFCAATNAEQPTYLDPYGAESIPEFFAVACEAYFVDGAEFQAQHPRLAVLFDGYF